MPFDPLELADHFRKHRGDFNVSSDKQYEALADQFLAGTRKATQVECVRRKGDRVRNDTITTEMAVISKSGVTRTYFKPRPCASLPPTAPRVPCHLFVDNVA
jgi:pyocin large subunit-like protein